MRSASGVIKFRRARLSAVRLILLGVGVTLPFSGCGPRPHPVHKERIRAMGTLVDIRLRGVDDQLAQRAFAAAAEDFAYMQTAYDAWKPGPMGRTNQLLALDAWFSANPSVLPLIKRAKALYRASDGLFNPAIGKLVGLWGFRSANLPAGPPPSQTAIERLVAAHPTMDDVEIKGIRVRSTNPAVQLDLSGFTKGYAIDEVIAHLRSLGVRNAIVDAGGDVRVIGSRGGQPWHVGIRSARNQGVLAEVGVRGDESVFTRRDYERYYTYKGRRYSQIIDPRTGHPSRGTTSVTVIHDNATTADATATALLIAGPKMWYRVARSIGIKYVMLVAADGTVYMNPAMAERIRFDRNPPKVILSKPL